VDALSAALDSGRHRGAVMHDFAVSRTDTITGSPTLRLADGTTTHNPGIQVTWQGPWAAGFPVIDSFDPNVYDTLVKRVAPV
jgi:hypothetical protein